ncbi:MAG: hypothetical protein IPP51_11975 [Bacteroidetes bacterium]|nr:hypothetical protein [Bacteroidota bacterium]
MRATNYVETKDSLLFTENLSDKMNNGMQITAPLSTSFNVFKYFNFAID